MEAGNEGGMTVVDGNLSNSLGCISNLDLGYSFRHTEIDTSLNIL